MNNLRFDIAVINDAAYLETEGPTLTIALGQALPSLSAALGNSRTFLGLRSYPSAGRTYGAFGLVPVFDALPDANHLHRYGTRQALPEFTDIEDDLLIEAYDVYEEMDEVEGNLRYLAKHHIDNVEHQALIREQSILYHKAVSNVLIYDPKARIDIVENLDEIFDGRDWRHWFDSSRLVHPHVQISKVEIVARADDALLIRFDYDDGCVCGRELEFATINNGAYRVRRDRYSALRGFQPVFNGWQLPNVHNSLQGLLDLAEFVDISDIDWIALAHTGVPELASA